MRVSSHLDAEIDKLSNSEVAIAMGLNLTTTAQILKSA
jgi:hypothetical protein